MHTPTTTDKARDFFTLQFDYKAVMQRFADFNRHLETDKDRIRVEGQCEIVG